MPEFDYSSPGAYFVTLYACHNGNLFGEIDDGGMKPGPVGLIVRACWNEIPAQFPHVDLDAFALMPDHLHGLLMLTGAAGAGHPRPLQVVIGSFKAAVSRRLWPGIWQRNHWEHAVRTEREANSIRHYIESNPRRRATDQENPACQTLI